MNLLLKIKKLDSGKTIVYAGWIDGELYNRTHATLCDNINQVNEAVIKYNKITKYIW